MSQPSTPQPIAAGPLVARASNEYRVKRLIIVLMLVGMGAYFALDGWIRWPRENQRIVELTKEKEVALHANDTAKVSQLDAEIKSLSQHSDTDLLMQKVLACALPPMGLFVLAWALYYSRGAYRLDNHILTVPGHPPIPLDAIRSIDRTDWDRKGIAWINYELSDHKTGSACLDDFIYQRKPTDDIFKQIETYTGTGEAPQSETASA